jgi:PST family polysaccharide transporter
LLHRIKNIANTEEKKRLLSNFFSLSVLQGANYILPLVTVPYLVRVLGAEYYGLLAFATATVAYFQIFTDYGFNLTATREISIHREDKEKVTEIFSSVMIIKFILMLLSFLLLTILVFSFEKFRKDALVYFLSYGAVVGKVLFPVWFFQGIERMKYITYINIGSRLLFTIAIFIFVQEKSDFYMVPLLSSLGTIIGGAYALYFIRKNFDLKFAFQKTETLIYYIKDSSYIFISNIAVSLYTISTTFILGIFTNNIMVGYFAIADKLINALKQLIIPISQALYPYISKKANISKKLALRIVKKLFIVLVPISSFISLFFFIYSKEIIIFIFSTQAIDSIIIFQILAIIPTLVVLDTLFGTLVMLVFKHNKAYSKIIFSAGIINILLLILLIPFFQAIGAAISVLLVEVYITLRIIFYTEINGLNIITKVKI